MLHIKYQVASQYDTWPKSVTSKVKEENDTTNCCDKKTNIETIKGESKKGSLLYLCRLILNLDKSSEFLEERNYFILCYNEMWIKKNTT